MRNARKLGEKIGCPTDTSKELLHCLKSRSAQEIIGNQRTFTDPSNDGPSFSPVIEKEHPGAFIIEHPYKLLVNKAVIDVPWIVSANEFEGIFVTLRKINISYN